MKILNIHLILENLRCHDRLEKKFSCKVSAIHEFQAFVVALTGPNGSGKTTILEALSLLVPGKGLRGASMAEIQRLGSQSPWRMALTLKDDEGGMDWNLETFLSGQKRRFRFNGELVKKQLEMRQWIQMLWPLQEEEPSVGGLRRYMNRICHWLDDQYAEVLMRYEHALKERNSLLIQGVRDRMWYRSVEEVLARYGIEILHRRVHILQKVLEEILLHGETGWEKFQTSLAVGAAAGISLPFLGLSGALEAQWEPFFSWKSIWKCPDSFEFFSDIEQNVLGKIFKDSQMGASSSLISQQRECSFEEGLTKYLQTLKEKFQEDSVRKCTTFGVHRSYFGMWEGQTGRPLGMCSKGEQKKMFLSLILAILRLIRKQDRLKPIFLLLDEVMSHMDQNSQKIIWQELMNLGIGVWVTGLDALPIPSFVEWWSLELPFSNHGEYR